MVLPRLRQASGVAMHNGVVDQDVDGGDAFDRQHEADAHAGRP